MHTIRNDYADQVASPCSVKTNEMKLYPCPSSAIYWNHLLGDRNYIRANMTISEASFFVEFPSIGILESASQHPCGLELGLGATPLAATSVATRIGVRPDLKERKASSRSFWVLSPWIDVACRP